jgi:hypothetical protein
MGWAGQGAFAAQFAGDSESPCFADPSAGEDGVFARFDASIDDLLLIDRQGQVRYEIHLADMDLGEKDNRKKVDRWVRGLAEEVPDTQ